MKKLKKRSIVTFLILFYMVVMGTSLLQTVRAAESDFVIDENGVLTEYKGSGGDMLIPNGVTEIGDRAFMFCENLTSVIFPNSLTSIGEGAFYKCNNLTSINIPNSVTSIEGTAFFGCSSLSSVTLPDRVSSIGYYAFGNCSNLNSISIPDSITSIGDYVFEKCDKLTSIYIYNDNVSISEYEGTLGNKDITTLYAHKGSTTEAYANKYGYKFVELPPDTKPLESISLNKPTITLDIGRTSLLSILYNPADTTDSKSVKWSSSNPEIAIVYSNGKVKAVSTGTATIAATVGDKTATCTVTVK